MWHVIERWMSMCCCNTPNGSVLPKIASVALSLSTLSRGQLYIERSWNDTYRQNHHNKDSKIMQLTHIRMIRSHAYSIHQNTIYMPTSNSNKHYIKHWRTFVLLDKRRQTTQSSHCSLAATIQFSLHFYRTLIVRNKPPPRINSLFFLPME